MLRYPESAVATIAAETLADGSSEILSAANRSTSEARTITNSLSKKACDEAKNIVSRIPENDFQNLKFKEIPRCCFEPKKIPLSRKETAKVWKTLAKRAQAKNPSRTNIPMEELAKDFESVANEIRAAKAEIKNNPTARSNRSRKRGARKQSISKRKGPDPRWKNPPEVRKNISDQILSKFKPLSTKELNASKLRWKDAVKVNIKDFNFKDGFPEVKSIDWEHISKMGCNKIKDNVNGLHTELMHPEYIKRITKLPNKNGVYEAICGRFGKLKKSTMFPGSWDEYKIIEKTLEAYDNPTSIKSKTGGTLVEGITKDGITISLFVKDNGIMKTYFPIYD